ncbi:serine hydrolase domain-containing protein [Polluticoccus soli]|uniref:serine hydrolase domain-containing protein n=1 Tax=Polluticoccus soli TaxID=3034150 RepID=UPI0023E28F16|nr:serine hydrolase domain-containing protein [Flavipsychrobacter sp. JY13-12]
MLAISPTRSGLITLVVFFISYVPLCAQEMSESGKADESLLFRDKAITENWLRKKNIPAVGIGHIEDGKIKEITFYGQRSHGQDYPSNTIFNVASLTKPITTMVVLKLIDAGKWRLDEPIYKYWTDPDIASDQRSKKLTTRHILTHKTGFPNWRYKNADGKLAFEFEPGTKYQYSGEGFEYLRKALEKKFKKSLDQLAAELIFKPLGMHDTHLYWDETVDESRFAEWYKADGSKYETYKNKSANAADDLLTTVEDYSKFLIYVMNGAGINKDLFAEMQSTQTIKKPRQHFGLGWMIDEGVNGDEDAITHGGDDKGVHTVVFILPQSKKGLVIFTNCDQGTETYIPAVKYYLGAAGQQIIDIETK